MSFRASKQRSVGMPPSPVTPPQFCNAIALFVSSQIEPHGLEHVPASRVFAQMWSAPPLAFQNGKWVRTYL